MTYQKATKAFHFSAALIVALTLCGAFWYLDRQHDKGPLGLHDSVALGAILAFVLIVAFPERLAAVTQLIRAWRKSKDCTP